MKASFALWLFFEISSFAFWLFFHLSRILKFVLIKRKLKATTNTTNTRSNSPISLWYSRKDLSWASCWSCWRSCRLWAKVVSNKELRPKSELACAWIMNLFVPPFLPLTPLLYHLTMYTGNSTHLLIRHPTMDTRDCRDEGDAQVRGPKCQRRKRSFVSAGKPFSGASAFSYSLWFFATFLFNKNS